jgi:hypothetical protein
MNPGGMAAIVGTGISRPIEDVIISAITELSPLDRETIDQVLRSA